MSREPGVGTLAEEELGRLDILRAGAVDLRRDVYRFVRYVREEGLVRTRNGNNIPKSAGRALAKILSWAGEAEAVEREGWALWSDHVSQVARELGLISFDTEGEYAGYSSTEPSFPENEVQVEEKEWRSYLKKTALEKERAILEVHLRTTPNEFFNEATLVKGEAFDSFGCATGPAGKMKLPAIRRGLLEFLLDLEPHVWYETRGVVDLLKERRPTLILDPSSRSPDEESGRRLRDWEWSGTKAGARRPEATLEDIYKNFRERKPGDEGWRRPQQQITSKTPDAFHRVEGRYLEFFLREIPHLCGFVELAYRKPSDRRGLDVVPPFERLRAFRLTPRFFQVLRGDAAFDKVKVAVLPNCEILVEAPSYPESTLEGLEPFAATLREEGPVHILRLEKKKVVEAAARDRGGRPVAEVLGELAASPLPQNVAVELASWAGHGGKAVCYEGFALLEIRGSAQERQQVLGSLGDLVQDDRLEGFAIVRDPARAFERLEEGLHVPVRIGHRENAFAACPGGLGAAVPAGRPAGRTAPSAEKARLESEDLVGYRTACAPLLAALEDALRGEARTCFKVGDDLLVLSAAAMPRLRAAIRRLSERFDISVAVAGARTETDEGR